VRSTCILADHETVPEDMSENSSWGAKLPDKTDAGAGEKARSAATQCPEQRYWVELEHSTEYLQDDCQVERAGGTPYRITFADGSQCEGVLDANGFARHDNIPKGCVDVEYEPHIDKDLVRLKQQLKESLDEIVQVERQEYGAIEQDLQNARVFGLDFPGSNSIAQAGMYRWAALKGVWNGVVGILSFAWDLLKGAGYALYELSLRLNPVTAPGKFAQDLQALKATYIELKRFADNDLEAYVILMGDAEVHAMLMQFAEGIIDAQHALEITEGGGEVAFDIILIIVTAGVGAAANVRHVGKLKKLKGIINKLVDAIKRKAQRKKRHNRGESNQRIGTIVRPTNFARQELLDSHFDKHVVNRDEFNGAYKTADEYLQGALDVVDNGAPVKYSYKGEERTGFVRFAGTSKPKGSKPYGDAKFEFVGTNNDGHITTYHIESKDFWKMLNGDKHHKVIYPAE